MKRSLLCVVLLGAASSARAQRAEELKGFGGVRLQHALGQGLSLSRWGLRPAAISGKDDLTRFLQERSHVVSSDGYAAPSKAAASVELSRLHNRNWKSPATFTMGGQTVYIGGAFDREQNAYISAYVGGWTEPRFFNIKGLLDREGSLTVGAVSYGVSLSANVLNPMKSQIVFENKADEEDQSRISVKKLLDSLNAAGETVTLSDQSYQLFYYSDVKEGANGPAVDPNSRTFAMILTEGDEMHVFLIPAENVPGNQVAVFKMYKDKRVGLQLVGTTLKVFENP